MAAVIPGYYGKLPAQGDFVTRRLPREFVSPWDSWEQNVLSCSREQLGEDWLDIYLTSPIWRFALAPGVANGDMWVGILMPSVDRVGRYFPFTIATSVAANCGPMQLVDPAGPWFDRLEEIALSALEDGRDLAALDDQLEALGGPVHESMVTHRIPLPRGSGKMMIRTGIASTEPGSPALTASISRVLNEYAPAHSVWWTRGSQRVGPSLLITEGFLPVTGFSALLDGNWDRWGWSDDRMNGPEDAYIRSAGGAGR